MTSLGNTKLSTNLSPVTIVTKTTSTSRTSVTAVSDDPELVITSVPTGTYALTGFLLYSGHTSGDIRFNFPGPTGGGSILWTVIGQDVAVSSGTGAANFASSLGGADKQLAGTSVNMVGIAMGTVTFGSPANFALQWAQGTSSGTPTSLLAGSWIRLERIG